MHAAAKTELETWDNYNTNNYRDDIPDDQLGAHPATAALLEQLATHGTHEPYGYVNGIHCTIEEERAHLIGRIAMLDARTRDREAFRQVTAAYVERLRRLGQIAG